MTNLLALYARGAQPTVSRIKNWLLEAIRMLKSDGFESELRPTSLKKHSVAIRWRLENQIGNSSLLTVALDLLSRASKQDRFAPLITKSPFKREDALPDIMFQGSGLCIWLNAIELSQSGISYHVISNLCSIIRELA